MPKPLEIELNESESKALERLRDKASKAYVRERAAAILKIADGMSALQVAQYGLLKVRKVDTVCEWVHRYQASGLAGLYIRAGRGRKAAFFPKHPDRQNAQASLLMVVRRDPRLFGHPQSRWSLQAILHTCDWLKLETLGGLSQLLRRLGICFKRARSYVHSPDRDYQAKVSYLTLARMRAWYEPDRFVFLYLDEFGYRRQPSLDRNYEQLGHHQALAYRSHRKDTEFRGIGALNVMTGQVIYRQHYKIKLRYLSDFYALIRATYPEAEVIYVAQDNWPIHAHPDVLVRLQVQHSPFWPNVPRNWSKQAHPKATQGDLPIQLLFLPTYASWLNPIEKLWRWLRQDVLHLHRLSDDWQAVKQAVWGFIAQFANGSDKLLRYVGLFPV